jgi:hypothetical protein
LALPGVPVSGEALLEGVARPTLAVGVRGTGGAKRGGGAGEDKTAGAGAGVGAGAGAGGRELGVAMGS